LIKGSLVCALGLEISNPPLQVSSSRKTEPKELSLLVSVFVARNVKFGQHALVKNGYHANAVVSQAVEDDVLAQLVAQ
jgi:hypothetical protein